MKTIYVNRKDHPCNPVLINEEDKLEGDKVVPAPKPKEVKETSDEATDKKNSKKSK